MTVRPTVEILRIESDPQDGTFGVLKVNGHAFCVTLERPWLDNRRTVSRIPAGTYVMHRHQTKEHGRCFEVLDVPERTDILIHWGNWVTDVKGCILVGKGYGVVRGKMYPSGRRGIEASQATYSALMAALSQHDTCNLVIREVG